MTRLPIPKFSVSPTHDLGAQGPVLLELLLSLRVGLPAVEVFDTRVFDRPQAGRSFFEGVIRDHMQIDTAPRELAFAEPDRTVRLVEDTGPSWALPWACTPSWDT